MKKIELIKVSHDIKVGRPCPAIEPNINEDCLLVEAGEVVGFYLKDISKHSVKAGKLAEIANRELRSKRVPKTEMSRGPQGTKLDKLKRKAEGKELVTQWSAILGGVAPKPHMRRDYPTISSVHSVKSASNFIKSMLLLADESEKLIKKYMPLQYEKQLRLINENAPDLYKFGNLFTSSISNCNIAANFHIDAANLKGCSNVIISKRGNSSGGNLHVPDYGVTFDSADNSMVVYPAWKNVHGVTPIEAKEGGGYRNTLVFYPLKAFKPYM